MYELFAGAGVGWGTGRGESSLYGECVEFQVFDLDISTATYSTPL